MTSVDEVTAAVGGAAEDAGQAAAKGTAAHTAATALARQLDAMGADGTAQTVNIAADQLGEANALLGQAIAKLQEAQTTAASAKGRLHGATGTASRTVASGRSRVPGFSASRPVGECVEAVKQLGWPKNSDGKTSARGLLYSSDGERLSKQPLQAHPKGKAPPCEDLNEPWRSDSRLTTTWHAERDVAAWMRSENVDHAVLYLNVPTCGKESQDAGRCHVNLPKVMPSGSTLTVWSVHEDGSTRRRRYEGTGEAIR